MNLILFEKEEISGPIPITDPRAQHVIRILRQKEGDSFDAGIVDGRQGTAKIISIGNNGMELEFSLDREAIPLYPVTLVVGMPRPQTVKKILRETTAIGASRIVFVRTQKSEPSYLQSGLWSSGSIRGFLIEGACQAFSTKLPVVETSESMESVLIGFELSDRLALDNYEATMPLTGYAYKKENCVLAIGPERGWSEKERNLLRTHGFTLVHIGKRILRTEAACSAGLILALSGLKLV